MFCINADGKVLFATVTAITQTSSLVVVVVVVVVRAVAADASTNSFLENIDWSNSRDIVLVLVVVYSK